MESDEENPYEANREELWRRHRVVDYVYSGYVEVKNIALQGVPEALIQRPDVGVTETGSLLVTICPPDTPEVNRHMRAIRRQGWKLAAPIHDDRHLTLAKLLEFEIQPPLDHNILVYRAYEDERDRETVRAMLLGDYDPVEEVGFYGRVDMVCSDQTVLAYVGSTLVGFMTFDVYDEANIKMISVFGPYRRQGYGRLMVHDFEAAVDAFSKEPHAPAHADYVYRDAEPFWRAVGWTVANGVGVGNHRPDPRRAAVIEPIIGCMANVEVYPDE